MRYRLIRETVLFFVVIILLISGIGLFGIYALNQFDASTKKILEKQQPILTSLTQVKSDLLNSRLKLDQYLSTGSKVHLNAFNLLVTSSDEIILSLKNSSLDEEERNILNKAEIAFDSYAALTSSLVSFYEKSKYDEEAGEVISAKKIKINSLLDNALLTELDSLYKSEQKENIRLGELSHKIYLNSLQMIIILILILIAIFIIISLFVSRNIVNPLIKMAKIIPAISRGEFDKKVNITSKNEIGDLAVSFNKMTSKLKKSRAELKEYNKNLEKNVAERTNQLNEKAREAENTKIATLNILDDIDESNRKLVIAQAKLKQDIDELKKLDIQKDQFISIAAHELKTPMTSIMGFSNLLNNPKIAKNPELRKKYLDIIFKDTTRLASLISNVLELSKMDLGVLKISWQNINVPDLIKEVREQMDIIIKSKNLKSEYKIENNLPIISIDKDKMIQVISNLINNAMHYTEKGKISLEAKKSNGNILFSVSDTGMGIPKEHIKGIFERFYQVDNPLTRKINGTGLGLSLCKGFVEAMGGKIWAESELGKGTTFYFTVPTKRKKAEEMKEIDIFKENKKPDKKEIKTPEKDSLKTKKK